MTNPEGKLPATLAEVQHPLVGVIMGSDSDLEVVVPAIDVLSDFNIPHETRIVSAHRTPDHMHHYAQTAFQRGIRMIIVGAGGSGHLPGMTSSESLVTVKGIAVNKKGEDPHGAALFSMIEMPPEGGALDVNGINAAGAVGAALSVVRGLAIAFPELYSKLEERRRNNELDVLYKDTVIQTMPPREYLKKMEDAKAHGEKWPIRPSSWEPTDE